MSHPLDSQIKTRVTRPEELAVPAGAGADHLVVIYSSDTRHLGRRQILGSTDVTMGRGSENTVVLDADSVSRRHARIEKRANGWYVVDLNSTNGTYVNDEPVNEHRLMRGDQVKVGDTILKFLSGSDVEAQYHETIYRMTIIDGLTGIHNKRSLIESLEREIPRAHRHERPLSVIIFDIDHFKKINDTFGHLAGDYVLKELATLARSRLRPDDVLGRYGGEEFLVILPETRLEGAAKIAEELRSIIEAHNFEFEDETIEVTVSAGTAQLHHGWQLLPFIKHADERLYQAKRTGRNRVCSG